jgi:hypothetical protein
MSEKVDVAGLRAAWERDREWLAWKLPPVWWDAFPRLVAAAEERDRLREALEDLMEVQNGPPLLKYEAAWNAAMEKGYAALNGGTARA